MIKAAGRIVLIALQWQTLCSYAYQNTPRNVRMINHEKAAKS
jgi:hypothetical protein